MIVKSTEIQNNFGKYLILASHEDIVITKNGMEIAKLVGISNQEHSNLSENSIVRKHACRYTYGNYGGRRATYEEFLVLTENSDECYEYIDGEIYYLASPKTAHQIALTELFGTFYNWFKGKKCRPMIAPYDIKLSRYADDKNVVQPDVMVICDLGEKLDEKDYYTGIPSLVVEILSQSTSSKDKVKKLDLYMCTGVKEYWVVDPKKSEVTVYHLGIRDIIDDSTYRPGDTAQSFIFPGLTVELKDIFRK